METNVSTSSQVSPASTSLAVVPSRFVAPKVEEMCCLIELQQRIYGLQANLVGEVIGISRILPIPGVHPAVTGLIHVRGAPLALLALDKVLDFAEQPSRQGEQVGLVIRNKEDLAAVLVDKVLGLFSLTGVSLQMVTASQEHPAVRGFALPKEGTWAGQTITLLNASYLLRQFFALGFSQGGKHGA